MQIKKYNNNYLKYKEYYLNKFKEYYKNNFNNLKERLNKRNKFKTFLFKYIKNNNNDLFNQIKNEFEKINN